MEKWGGRVAIVTGASSGIGKSIAEELVKNGMKVVGVARRVERMEEHSRLLSSYRGSFHPFKCDVTIEDEILNVFAWTKKKFGRVDVMVNNAGILICSTVLGGETKDWKRMFDINVFATAICSRESVKLMKEMGIDDGHIININSVVGKTLPPMHSPQMVMLYASKHAAMIQSLGLKQELYKENSGIRVTNICPAVVKTEALDVLDPNWSLPTINADEVAQTVVFVLASPPNVEIQELVVRNVKDSAI